MIRKAIRFASEQEAVNGILRAQKEPTLKGELRGLVKKSLIFIKKKPASRQVFVGAGRFVLNRP